MMHGLKMACSAAQAAQVLSSMRRRRAWRARYMRGGQVDASLRVAERRQRPRLRTRATA
ncbi:MAG: hypothetical protein IPO35_02420 [Uliginosibacterium sp.]|nr:hypothetical protein [Uliginosibacterium sp.]